MGATFDYTVSLQITHPTAPVSELAGGFPWPMTSGWTAGEPRITPVGRELGGVRSESYCSLKIAQGDDGELTACLSRAVAVIQANGRHWEELRRTGGRLNFYVFWYPNGDTGAVLGAGLLGQMAALGIDLGLNVYEDQSTNG